MKEEALALSKGPHVEQPVALGGHCSLPARIEWLTAEEAAHHLRVQVRTILAWTRQGKIKGYALSGIRRRVWRYLRHELDAALLESAAPSVLIYRRVN